MVWKKGVSGNPAGGKPSPIRAQFQAALAAVEKKQGKSLLVHLCEVAYKDPAVLVAVAKKMLPDLTEAEIRSSGSFIVIRPAQGTNIPEDTKSPVVGQASPVDKPKNGD